MTLLDQPWQGQYFENIYSSTPTSTKSLSGIVQYISYKSHGRVCDLPNKNWDLILCVLDDKDERTINNHVLLLSKCCSNLHTCGGSSFSSFFSHLVNMRLGGARANEEDKQTSTMDLCLIRLTEIGADEIPSNSAFWLNTWMIKSWSRLICATITNPFDTQFSEGFSSIHVSLYLEGWHLEEDILNEVGGFNSVVLTEDVEEVGVASNEVLIVA